MARKQNGYSLRYILIFWFLIFSIIPLLLMTFYSLIEFQIVFYGEQRQRLEANFKEIASEINLLEDQLATHIQQYASHLQLAPALQQKSTTQIKSLIENWMQEDSPISQIAIFDNQGASLFIFFKEDKNIQERTSGTLYLPSDLQNELQNTSHKSFRDIIDNRMELTTYSQVVLEDQVQGFIQGVYHIDKTILNHFKQRLNLNLVILDHEQQPIVSTSEQKELVPQNTWLLKAITPFFKLIHPNPPYGLFTQSIDPDRMRIFLGLASVQTSTENTLVRRISKALFTGVVVMIILLIGILIVVSRVMIIRPVSDLVKAAKQIEDGQLGTQIPIKASNSREINKLIATFNNMSLWIAESISQLEEANQQLEKANKELQETQAQLVHSAKMVSLGQLVAGVAHELNNPIGFIDSNMAHLEAYSKNLIQLIQLMQNNPQKVEKFKEDIDYDYLVKDLPKLIKSCQDGSKRVMDIVVSLRSFSRIDDSTLQDYHLKENIQNTLELLSGEIKTRIQVDLDIEDSLKIQCNAGQINQVLMNIISNAAHAIEDKGHIKIVATKHDQQVKITIEDNGRGIPSDHIHHVFDPFFTTKAVGQGTGLGLSISYNLVQKHGGQITVTSEENKGTTFIITLPLELFP